MDAYGNVRITIEAGAEEREINFALASLWIAGNPAEFAEKVAIEVRKTMREMLGLDAEPREEGNGDAPPAP